MLSNKKLGQYLNKQDRVMVLKTKEKFWITDIHFIMQISEENLIEILNKLNSYKKIQRMVNETDFYHLVDALHNIEPGKFLEINNESKKIIIDDLNEKIEFLPDRRDKGCKLIDTGLYREIESKYGQNSYMVKLFYEPDTDKIIEIQKEFRDNFFEDWDLYSCKDSEYMYIDKTETFGVMQIMPKGDLDVFINENFNIFISENGG